ncbi:MAG: ribosomal protein L7/L12 [Candidatus Competibacteraceae bacterium]
MMLGPAVIKQCSACSKPIKQNTILSGNTFGAKFWTDGKREAPMLPDQPWLVLCPYCHAPLWINELQQLGESNLWCELNGNFRDALHYDLPSLDDYFALLEQGVDKSGKEQYLRLRAWWAGNDLRRNQETDIPMSAREASNLAVFATMLDESDADERVIKAEVMRELSCFDEASELLARAADEPAMEIIKSLIAKSDPYVRQIHFNETPTPKAPVRQFNVVMTRFGANRIGVIKAIRALTGLSPIAVKALVDNVPATVREAISLKEAVSIKNKLKEAGATIKLRRYLEA